MTLVTQNDPGGLAAALPQIGSILGNALQKRGERQQQQVGAQALASQFDPNSPVGKIFSNPQVAQYIASNPHIVSLLGSVLGEQTKQEGIGGFFDKYKPSNKERESPIEIAKRRPNIEIEEGEYIQTPQGTFGAEDIVDLPTFGKIPRYMIGEALKNPNEQVRRWGEGAQKELEGQENRNRKRFESDRAYHAKETEKAKEYVRVLRESIPGKENALSLARNAVESKEVGRFSKAALSNALPTKIGKILQNAKGSQLITASKENLLSNMSRVSARAQNQWFEQRLNSMFPQIGISEEANLTMVDMLEGEIALDKLYTRTYDKLADEDRKKYGYIREGIDRRTRDALKGEEKMIFDRTMYRLKRLEEVEKGQRNPQQLTTKSVAKNTPLTLETMKMFADRYGPAEGLKVAKKLGYYIPTQEEVRFYLKDLKEL